MGKDREDGLFKQKNFRLVLSKPLDRKVYEKLEELPSSTQSAVIKMAIVEYFERQERKKVIEEMYTCLDSIRTLEDSMIYLVEKLTSVAGGSNREEEYL